MTTLRLRIINIKQSSLHGTHLSGAWAERERSVSGAAEKSDERERSGERTLPKTPERERSAERGVDERERSGERDLHKHPWAAERQKCRSRSAHMLCYRWRWWITHTGLCSIN